MRKTQATTRVHKYLSPSSARDLSGKLRGVAMDSMGYVQALQKLGIDFSEYAQKTYADAYAQDAAIAIPGLNLNTTSPNSPFLQFLQSWLPGYVQVVTAARKADSLLGMSVVGNWEDEEVIQEMLEHVGVAQPYTDLANIPRSSWNLTYERRGVVRFEEGFSVGQLEALRSNRVGVDSNNAKRNAATTALEVSRNRVAFYGYSVTSGSPVYGMLNEPNLLPYVSVPAGASGTQWSVKTRNEIIKDILTCMALLRKVSGEVVDPQSDKLVLAVASAKVDYLHTVSEQGSDSVMSWLKSNYPNLRVESATELNSANGSADVCYLYAEGLGNTGTDDGAALVQIVPTRLKLVGVDTSCKEVMEDLSNATAGCLCKRPYAVQRLSGI